jgi:hypothetical protein
MLAIPAEGGGYQGETRPLGALGLIALDNMLKRAIPAKTAPAVKVAAGPNSVHNQPAKALAASSAPPVIKLNIPNAVPRRSAGAASTTRVESKPCVAPMWRPQSTTPTKTCHAVAAVANTMSAAISNVTCPPSRNWKTR